uniref:Uncharacterized protein n=1 Tax=Anguilla anguilla TaxID=7936 RepID=A0A0E9UI43_ANGAN
MTGWGFLYTFTYFKRGRCSSQAILVSECVLLSSCNTVDFLLRSSI